MKSRKPKAVRAWAFVFDEDGQIHLGYVHSFKCRVDGPGEWIRVEIRPVPKPRRARRSRK